MVLSSAPQIRVRISAALALIYLLIVCSRSASAADNKYWELSTYRVQLHVTVSNTLSSELQLEHTLASELENKIRATLYPLWSTRIDLPKGIERHRQLLNLANFHSEPNTDPLAGCDKQMYLNIKSTPIGYQIECREFDCTTLRWSAIQLRQVRQRRLLAVQCFQLLCSTFSPLAMITTLPESDDEVQLRFRGSDLPAQADLSFLVKPGEAYQPMMVRTNTAGELKKDSLREIPWTYVTLDKQHEGKWHAKVHTGTRLPFGVRRRGRIEHLALALRNPTGVTQVRFYARHDQSEGLSGYEIFRRESNREETQPLGLTNTHGVVEIVSGEADSQVSLLFLRSEGQLLAKVPVVPGAKPLLEVPVADDTARLRAQADLTSLTERLIDTVAQRIILIARVRNRIEAGELDEAQELFTSLDNLPGRAQFDQDIKTVENRQQNRSNDPKVQASIDKLFADTRKLLGSFLSTKQITDVQSELTAARRGNESS